MNKLLIKLSMLHINLELLI